MNGPLRQRRPRQHDERHLAFIRGLPCCTCANNTATEAAHIRMPSPRYGKIEPGNAKPDDMWTVPLCGRDHLTGPEAQHTIGEEAFWKKHAIDPFALALSLYVHSGDQVICETIINETRVARRVGVAA